MNIMNNVIKGLHLEIKRLASETDINVQKLNDFLAAYQLLKPYQPHQDEVYPSHEIEEYISKLSDLDINIIRYIGNNNDSILRDIHNDLRIAKSTISYRIKLLTKDEILIIVPTLTKVRPIGLSEKGNAIFLRLNAIDIKLRTHSRQ